MKIAICLSGYLRGFTKCLPTWQQHLLRQPHTFDCFACLGPTTDVHLNDNIIPQIDLLKSAFNTCVVQTTGPVAPPFDPIFNQNKDANRNVQWVLSMFDKIQKANGLKMEHEHTHGFTYDVVMRFRPDTYLVSDIDFTPLYADAFYLPQFGDFGGLNDQMAWSSSTNMDYYASLFDHIKSYLKNDPTLAFNPEFLLKRHLQGKNIIRPHVVYQLARNSSYMLPDNEMRERILRQSGGTRNT